MDSGSVYPRPTNSIRSSATTPVSPPTSCACTTRTTKGGCPPTANGSRQERRPQPPVPGERPPGGGGGGARWQNAIRTVRDKAEGVGVDGGLLFESVHRVGDGGKRRGGGGEPTAGQRASQPAPAPRTTAVVALTGARYADARSVEGHQTANKGAPRSPAPDSGKDHVSSQSCVGASTLT